MTIREVLFAAAAALALVAVVFGIHQYSVAAAWIAGGVLFGGWSWLILGGDDE